MVLLDNSGMPSHSKYDPRHYIRPVPLPITSQKGIKIQARSSIVYNPTLPTRDNVRAENYNRRCHQRANQGFSAINYKPYEGLGDPFYLNQKQLILHALGQHDQGQCKSSDSGESEPEEDRTEQQEQGKQAVATEYVLRRPRKGLITLNKEVAHGREMIKNVRLGHGLFSLIQREEEDKELKRQAEERIREQQRGMCQPPKYDSSSSDDDDDVDFYEPMDPRHFTESTTSMAEVEDHGIAKSQHLAVNGATESSKSRVAFHGLQNSSGSEISRPPKREGSGRSRKNMPSPRPYTPQHTNIAVEPINVMEPSNTDSQALFRQLCVLYWILEGMNSDVQDVVNARVSSCWKFKEMGKVKTVSTVAKQKLDKDKWRQFTSSHHLKIPHKRISTTQKALRLPRRPSARPRTSIASTQLSPADSQSQLGVNPNPNIRVDRVDSVIPEDSECSTQGETGTLTDHDEDDELFKPGMFPFLDDYYSSLEKKPGDVDGDDKHSALEMASAKSDGSGHSGRSPPTARRRMRMSESDSAITTRRSSAKKPTNAEISKHLEMLSKSEEDPQMHRLANPMEKRSSQSLRADYNIRPKSSVKVVEFQSSCSSIKHRDLTRRGRDGFAEVAEEKALELHDTIEYIERERPRKLRSKLERMPTGNRSFYRALKEMRAKSLTEEEMKEKRDRQKEHKKWYSDLKENIPEELQKKWYFEKILEKLLKYGQVDSPKQNHHKFLRVLGSELRYWEVCSPDVSAAIEFCRERIVELPVKNYENWLQQNFRVAQRPQTAPPALKSQAEHKRERPLPANSRMLKSAPPAGRIQSTGPGVKA